MIDLQSLFEPSHIVEEFDDELEALRTGRKAMSVFTFSRAAIEDIETRDSDYDDIAKLAFDADMVVVHHGIPTYGSVDVFVVGRSQLWRVEAYVALKDSFAHAGCMWSDGAEVMESRLLGYSERSTTMWIDSHRLQSIRWGFPTLCFIMNGRQMDAIENTKRRCIPRQVAAGILVFRLPMHQILRRDALVHRADAFIGRVAVKHRTAMRLFGDAQDDSGVDVMRVEIDDRNVDELDDGIESTIELWDEGTWR